MSHDRDQAQDEIAYAIVASLSVASCLEILNRAVNNFFLDARKIVVYRHGMMRKHLKRAIEIAGGQCALARATQGRVKQENISYWLNRAKKQRIPGEAALAIERATAGKVTAAQLRPDLFGRRRLGT